MDFLGLDLSPLGLVALMASGLVCGLLVGAVIGALSAVYRRG